MTDIWSDLVSRGSGAVALGSGRMLIYGKWTDQYGGVPGLVFVSNDLHDEEAETLIREAVLEMQSDIRRSSKESRRKRADLAVETPAEE